MTCVLSFRAAVFVLGIAAIAAPTITIAAPIAPTPVALPAADAPPTMIHRAAIGDPPPGSRRRGRRAAGKDKPYQPLAKDPQGESATAHKEYLKRYGF